MIYLLKTKINTGKLSVFSLKTSSDNLYHNDLIIMNVIIIKICYIVTLDRAINQRCNCVNKWKKRKQVGVMKEYRQVPAAVELIGIGWPVWGLACRLKAVALSNPRQDAEEVPSGFLKITQCAMVKRRSWVNIAICPCLHSSLTRHRTSTISRIKCERYIFLYRSVFICSLKFVNYVWLCFRLYLYVSIQQILQENLDILSFLIFEIQVCNCFSTEFKNS